MVEVSILRSEPPGMERFDAALKEFLFDLRLAHWKRLEFTGRLEQQQQEIYTHLAEMRRGNITAKSFRIDLLV